MKSFYEADILEKTLHDNNINEVNDDYAIWQYEDLNYFGKINKLYNCRSLILISLPQIMQYRESVIRSSYENKVMKTINIGLKSALLSFNSPEISNCHHLAPVEIVSQIMKSDCGCFQYEHFQVFSYFYISKCILMLKLLFFLKYILL